MFFLAPVIGSICSAAASIGTSAIAAGSALGSSALAAGGSLASAGGTLASAGGTLAAAGRTLAAGAKVLTLEEAAKYVGAAYIGSQIAKNRQRQRQPEEQNQGGREPRVLYYVETEEGLVPVYGER